MLTFHCTTLLLNNWHYLFQYAIGLSMHTDLTSDVNISYFSIIILPIPKQWQVHWVALEEKHDDLASHYLCKCHELLLHKSLQSSGKNTINKSHYTLCQCFLIKSKWIQQPSKVTKDKQYAFHFESNKKNLTRLYGSFYQLELHAA